MEIEDVDVASDHPDSKKCKFAQGLKVKELLSAISSAWKVDLETSFINRVRSFYDYDPTDHPGHLYYYKVQQDLKNVVTWICEFNTLSSLDDFEYKKLTTLEELQKFLIRYEISRVYPISYCKNYEQATDALKLSKMLQNISANDSYFDVLPSFEIGEESDEFRFLKKLDDFSGDLSKLKYFEAQEGDQVKKALVAKDLLYNFIHELEPIFVKDRRTGFSFDAIIENSHRSLSNLLKDFPDLLMELSNEFSYSVSEDSPSLKSFLEGNEENLEVFCYLASLPDSLKFYFNFLLKGMVLDSVLQLFHYENLVELSPEEKIKANKLEENLFDLANLAYSYRTLIFPRGGRLPVLKIKELFDLYLSRIKNLERFDDQIKDELCDILREKIPFIEDQTREYLLKCVEENKFSELKSYFEVSRNSLLDFIKREYLFWLVSRGNFPLL